MLEQVLLVCISPTQLFVMHRAYRTPYKLHQWHRRKSPDCPRWGGSPADLMHVLWRCPILVHYWHCVISIIDMTFQTALQHDPLNCILGFLDEELYTPQAQTTISRLLFLAHKSIMLKWLSPTFED